MSDQTLRIVIIADDSDFLSQAYQDLKSYQLIHISPANLPPKDCQVCQEYHGLHLTLDRGLNTSFDYAIIDARQLSDEVRYRLQRLGKASQKIAVGDRTLNNILAKIHVPVGFSLRSAIANCLDLAQARISPRGLKQELSDLPYT